MVADGNRPHLRLLPLRRRARLSARGEGGRRRLLLRAGRRAAVRLHGRDAGALRHRRAPVRGHSPVDPPAAGRPGGRHRAAVRGVRRGERRCGRDRVGGRPARHPDHAALRVQQGPHFRHHLRGRLARHHHPAVGGGGHPRSGGRRVGGRPVRRHAVPGTAARAVLRALHPGAVHAEARGRAAPAAERRRSAPGPAHLHHRDGHDAAAGAHLLGARHDHARLGNAYRGGGDGRHRHRHPDRRIWPVQRRHPARSVHEDAPGDGHDPDHSARRDHVRRRVRRARRDQRRGRAAGSGEPLRDRDHLHPAVHRLHRRLRARPDLHRADHHPGGGRGAAQDGRR